MVSANSATACVGIPGVFNTSIPRCLAACKSIESIPTPHRDMHLKLGKPSRVCASYVSTPAKITAASIPLCNNSGVVMRFPAL